MGNGFDIRIRQTSCPPDEIGGIIDSVTADIRTAGGYPNYFGVQRFGVVRPITHKVGELLVKGDIEGAVRCYVCDPPRIGSDTEAERVRKML